MSYFSLFAISFYGAKVNVNVNVTIMRGYVVLVAQYITQSAMYIEQHGKFPRAFKIYFVYLHYHHIHVSYYKCRPTVK